MMRSTFAVPALLAAATATGLLVALTGDGWRDVLGWVGLAAPVAAIGWGWRRRGSRRRS